MSRNITEKTVQVIAACKCGATYVYDEIFPIRYKDFSKASIVRKKDQTTGANFLVQKLIAGSCGSCDVDLQF